MGKARWKSLPIFHINPTVDQEQISRKDNMLYIFVAFLFGIIFTIFMQFRVCRDLCILHKILSVKSGSNNFCLTNSMSGNLTQIK